MAGHRILVVEDEAVMATFISNQLDVLGYQAVGLTSKAGEATAMAGELLPDLVLMDILLADGSDGVQAAQDIRSQFGIPVVFVTAHSEDDLLARAKQTEPFGYILKPFSARELRAVVEMALYKHAAERRLMEASKLVQSKLEGMVIQRTAELMMAREQAEAANLAKSAFLANVSHEIRTPLNAILGFAHALRRGMVDPYQLERLHKLERAGRHLQVIINDVLDISKIEAGRLELDRTDFLLSSVLDNVTSIAGPLARVKGLHFQVSLAPELVDMPLCGDLTRLSQALLNYAANAVKFTEKGSVCLRAMLLDSSGEDLHLRFEVIDTGIGIAPESVRHLFKDFSQVDTATTRKYGGTGLGLSITRRLVRLMQGEVGVQSNKGQGSTFWFTVHLLPGVPMALMPSTKEADAESLLRQHHAGKRFLVVDDDALNREVAVDLFEPLGISVDTAVDGRDAVEEARAHTYDLILMDVQMPGMNGLDACAAILAMLGPHSPPVVALTANAFAEDRRACLQAGMRDFVAKPIVPAELYNTVLKCLNP